MQRKKRLSNEFICKLAELSGGALNSYQFDQIISLMELEIKRHYFTPSSEANLIRIIDNQFDKIFFLKECLNYPHHIELIISIASNSNYLTDILVRNPEYFYLIINPDKLKKPLAKKKYIELVKETINKFRTFDGKVNALRNLKRRELLRIGITDIYLKENLERITTELSLLAKSISSVLFELCYREILTKYKIEKHANRYCLIALGKLGGDELNYSSDIDLIALTDKNKLVNNKIYYNQILTETIQLFIDQASSVTPKGFLYRVDFRLRPDGRNAPLCGTLSQYLQYYEMRGEDWERQMLIKSGFIGGSLTLYKKFTSFTERFIYRSLFAVSPLVQIKKLKSNIEKTNAEGTNVKLLPGGIRDIEFSIQALQLLNGGKIPFIRSGNTLTAVKLLKEYNLLSKAEAQIFSDAYIFYRKIEHYLQLMNNAQTHSIPDSGELPQKLSSYLGFESAEKFNKLFIEYRNKISGVYKSITGEDISSVSILPDINFSDEKRARINIEFLQYGRGILAIKKFDSLTISQFENIRSQLFDYLKNSLVPDKILENFTRIIKSAQFPGIWYREFSDNNYFRLFLRLCEYSQYTINLFAEDKYLRDLFLSRKCFEKISEISVAEGSTKETLFKLSSQYNSGMITSGEVNSLMSMFISEKIKTISNAFSVEKKWKNDFLIIAMGSLGAKEIAFTSDIDLIFIANGIKKYQRIQNDFQELLSEIENHLVPFDTDCRLRPEGKSSILVWDLNSYSEYLLGRARIWELQAFLKAEYICGNRNIFDKLIDVYVNKLNNTDQRVIKNEMSLMRNKIISTNSILQTIDIKKGSGGITDIEFITSFYLLSNTQTAKKCIGKGTINSLKTLSLNKEKEIYFRIIADNFSRLKEVELANQNLFDSRTAKLPVDELKINLLSDFLGYKNSNAFRNELNNILSCNYKISKELFK